MALKAGLDHLRDCQDSHMLLYMLSLHMCISTNVGKRRDNNNNVPCYCGGTGIYLCRSQHSRAWDPFMAFIDSCGVSIE